MLRHLLVLLCLQESQSTVPGCTQVSMNTPSRDHPSGAGNSPYRLLLETSGNKHTLRPWAQPTEVPLLSPSIVSCLFSNHTNSTALPPPSQPIPFYPVACTSHLPQIPALREQKNLISQECGGNPITIMSSFFPFPSLPSFLQRVL